MSRCATILKPIGVFCVAEVGVRSRELFLWQLARPRRRRRGFLDHRHPPRRKDRARGAHRARNKSACWSILLLRFLPRDVQGGRIPDRRTRTLCRILKFPAAGGQHGDYRRRRLLGNRSACARTSSSTAGAGCAPTGDDRGGQACGNMNSSSNSPTPKAASVDDA